MDRICSHRSNSFHLLADPFGSRKEADRRSQKLFPFLKLAGKYRGVA